jgi:hypothetical protein
MMSDINKIMEAYLGMVSEPQVEETLEEKKIGNMGPYGMATITKALAANGIKGAKAIGVKDFLRKSGTVNEEVEEELDEACGKKSYKEGQEECPKCEGEGCDHCDNKGYHEVSEKKLDPVDDKENDKKFKNRKDKDIDNDGDVDSSDEYLHKRRAATDDAIDAKDDEENPVKKNPKTADKKSEISKIESLDLRSDFEKMWSEMAEAIDPKKGATAPEKHDDHSSDHDKKVIGMHKKSDKKVEDEEEKSHDTVFKAAGKDMKQSPARSGADNLSNGDKSIVNPVKGK